MSVLEEYYIWEGRVLNCAQYGVPQQRKRLIVVGVRKDIATCGAFHPAPTHRTPVTVGEAFAVAALRSPPSSSGQFGVSSAA
jgi:DNA (cytosine-5)-methyltransferase 1